jgi:hypothetical protein
MVARLRFSRRRRTSIRALFNSLEEMRLIAKSEGLDLEDVKVFYYEADECELYGVATD